MIALDYIEIVTVMLGYSFNLTQRCVFIPHFDTVKQIINVEAI